MKKLAITGAAGRVGTGIRKHLLHRGYRVHHLDLQPVHSLGPNESSATVDVTDTGALTRELRGCDGVLHLAGRVGDASWQDLMDLNADGAVSLFEAARAAAVPRVIYASTNHVAGLYPRAASVTVQTPMRPDSRYGVTKAFGELVASLNAYKYGLAVMCIRIGNAHDFPVDRRRLGNWISWRDLAQLVAIGLETDNLVYEVVWGVSDASGIDFDNSRAYQLGYRPQDKPEDFIAQILATDPEPSPTDPKLQQPVEMALGGHYAQSEFVGSTARLRAAGDAGEK